MSKYSVIDVAISKLKKLEELAESDNGIRYLSSGGDSESVNAWYRQMEADRTPAQRTVKRLQDAARDEYEIEREKVIPLIKRAQRSVSLPRFYVPNYEGEWREFRAPNRALAQKFLEVLNNQTYGCEVLARKEVKPFISKLSIC